MTPRHKITGWPALVVITFMAAFWLCLVALPWALIALVLVLAGAIG